MRLRYFETLETMTIHDGQLWPFNPSVVTVVDAG